jgi:hypothetical protein
MLQHAESSLQSADFNLDYDRQSEHGYDPARLRLRDIRRLRFIPYLMVVEAQLRLGERPYLTLFHDFLHTADTTFMTMMRWP